jgi:hypothetical protein
MRFAFLSLLIALPSIAQEPTCGVAFITSEMRALPLATCTLSGINEDGSRGDPFHVYDVDAAGSQRIDFTAAIFMELQVAGLYDLHCTDSMGLESLPASGGRCLRPGTPEIKSD